MINFFNLKEKVKLSLDFFTSSNEFDFLLDIKSDLIYEFIQEEHPQIVAVILSNIENKKAAEIITCFEEDVTREIMMNIVNIGNIDKKYIEIIARNLKNSLYNELKLVSGIGGYKKASGIISELEENARKEIVEQIGYLNQEMSEGLKVN